MPDWMSYVAVLRGSGVTAATSATINPDAVSGLVAWFSADSGAYQTSLFLVASTGGDSVGGWRDRSPGAKDATQANVLLTPTLSNNAINSLPSIDFNGTDQFLSANDIATIFTGTANAPATFFGVFKTDAITTTQDYFMMGRNSSATTLMGYDVLNTSLYRSLRRGDDGVLKTHTGGAVTTAWKLFNSIFINGTSSNLYINGALVGGQNNDFSGAAVTLDRASIGARDSGGTRSNYVNGQIAEIILYNTDISESDRVGVQNYLNDKYAIY